MGVNSLHRVTPGRQLHAGVELGRREPANANLVRHADCSVCRGYFAGDYEGLDNFGTAFTPFFVQGEGTDPFHQLRDAFYSTAGP